VSLALRLDDNAPQKAPAEANTARAAAR
jgi:hypothetical protein